MPRKCKHSWLDTYIDYTQFQEAPLKYHIWTGLSTIASIVRRNVWLPRGYFNIYPNLYIAIVGPTGITKTTAADMGIAFVESFKDLELMKEKLTSFFVLEYFDKLTKSKGECCITIYAPEMKTFLGDLNKAELVALLTSFYGCPDTAAYRTKGSGIYQFKNICINLLVCSTPEWLTLGTTTDEIAGGFTGRFLYVFEDSTTRSSPFPEDLIAAKPEILVYKQDLKDDLEHIATIKGKFIITDQAKAEYIIWYKSRGDECRDERMRGYFARKRDVIFKVAMLVSLAQDDSLVIDDDILKQTFKLLTELETNMVKAFAGVVDDPALKYKDMILTQIAVTPGQNLTRSQILRKNWNRFDGQILDRIIANLIDARVIKSESVRRGRQMEVVYTLIDSGMV